MGLKPGDCAFFKKAKEGTKYKDKEVIFQGFGYGILLGHCPPGTPAPPVSHLIRNMGAVGFVSFDDIGHFLGPAQAEECVKKFELKYYGKEYTEEERRDAALNPPEGPKEEPKSNIVGLDGKPIEQ